MSGDVSVLDRSDLGGVKGVPIKTMRQLDASEHNWNAQDYIDQQQREAEIYKTYTNDGQLKLQPNKTQNKKHQLTSLALKAAETEIALMEAKGAKQKTRAQTQSRYGW